MPAPVVLKKELVKNSWDDEDVDEDDIKESWEDEEPAPVYFFICFHYGKVYASSLLFIYVC